MNLIVAVMAFCRTLILPVALALMQFVSGISTAKAAVNTWCKPQCVDYVKAQLPNNSKWRKTPIGKAFSWWDKETDKSKKGDVPLVKSIVVFDKWGKNDYGHVGIVVDVKGDSILVNHANWNTPLWSFDCKVTDDWFMISDDRKSLNRNNAVYPLKGFVYAWGYSSIREVDFNNFNYDIENTFCSEILEKSSILLKSGEYGDYRTFWFSIDENRTIYGDITGDGREDAVVLTMCGGMHATEQPYIYTIKNGQVVDVLRRAF